jgi:hypothetical protein
LVPNPTCCGFKTWRSGLHLDAIAKGNPATDFFGLGLGVGVVPNGIGLQFAINQQRQVAGLAFPRTGGFVVAEGDELALEAAFRK